MLKAYVDNKCIAHIAEPIYVKQLPNGNFTNATLGVDATDIAINGKVYALYGSPSPRKLVILSEYDAGYVVDELDTVNNDMDSMLVDQEYRLVLLELGV